MTTSKLNQKTWRHLAKQVSIQKRLTAVLTIGVFAVLGVAILLWAHAATPVISLETESGTLASGATAVTDANASGGKAVKFSASNPGSPQPVGVPGNWTLKFDDEFNGTSLDTSKWANYCKTMNKVTTSLSNVSVANGVAMLQLASSGSGAIISTSSVDGCGDPANPYSLPVGGYAEARIYFPGTSGGTQYNWPAWWASGPSWPAAGENDIVEGYDSTLSAGNYHSPSGANNGPHPSGNWVNSYHTYGLWRKASSAEVYWDGNLVRSYSTNDNGAPQSLIVNVGAGNTTMYGAASQVKVDYVRAWQ